MLVADECRSADTSGHFTQCGAGRLTLEAPRFPGARALLFDGRFKSRLIESDVLLTAGFRNEVHRKAIGVIQLKNFGAREHVLTGGSHLGQHVVENRQPLVEGGDKPFFFAPCRLRHRTGCRTQFVIGLAHLLHDRRRQFMQERFGNTQQPAMASRASQNPAEHISTSFIRRQDAVGHEECDGPQVIRNDAHGTIRLFHCTVLRSGPASDRRQQGRK